MQLGYDIRYIETVSMTGEHTMHHNPCCSNCVRSVHRVKLYEERA